MLRLCLRYASLAALLISTRSENPSGLLFYLSGDHGFEADFAQGSTKPAALQDVTIIPDGAKGSAFRCPHFTQILAYSAPGNLYAQRGTLSFFWRARDPIGKTPFPIFQASYSDHSSVDMCWLRIDYNGNGFDAFVTDASLARVRASHQASVLPRADEWMHFALTWDENVGIRFFVNGQLVGKQDIKAVFYAGLDKFGAHSDAIGPQDVVTMEQYMRGGDIDEIRIYGQMLSSENVGRLFRGEELTDVPPEVRDLDRPVYRNEWWVRYGWNRVGDIPPYLSASSTRVRTVEIHDVYDLKQWFWKANDGIRETTWPGVYNRSRLPGRNDYFPRPDWNCYSLSGKSVTFTLPAEPWNHLEISGSASGSLSLLGYDKETHKYKESFLFDRPENQERTFDRLLETVVGGDLRFDNEVQETPIGEFSALYVSPGGEPQGRVQLSYTLTADVEPDNATLQSLVNYIDGRFLPDERAMVVALPAGAPASPKKSRMENALPLVHILIPFEFRYEMKPSQTTTTSTRQTQRVTSAQADSAVGGYSSKFSYTWENLRLGLDGVAIDLPALQVKPTHGEYLPLNIQIKDPLWPDRNLLDFSFSVRPGEAKTLWLDTRDRILPNGYPLYLTLAAAGGDFGPDSIRGAELRLIFKDRKEAQVEHEVDRFIQVKDNQGHMVEWHTNKKPLKLYDRFSRDITDLLQVNPDHEQGSNYWSYVNPEQGWPHFEQPEAPADVPLWAFRQVEVLKLLKRFINWWIDQRQIDNGEFGGGLSDDGDLTHLWPGAALMGIEPKKITDSLCRLMDAFYQNGMFTDGLNTIMTDQLHTYEEGIQVQPQVMALKYADPQIVERMMETAKALERITGVDKFGHRHIRSSYFSGSQISEDPAWARVKLNFYSHLILHPALVLVEYNGHPAVKKLMLELAEGLLAHRKKDANGNYYLPGEVLFPSGEEVMTGFSADVAHLFWAAWRWTGEEKFLLPILDSTDQGEEFDIVRYLTSNVLDLLGKRESWGKRMLSTLRTGRLRHLGPAPQTLSWSATSRTRPDFFRHVAWQVTGNKSFLEDYYADQIQDATQRMSMFTEDHWWIDMVGFPSAELQRSRLGGVGAFRMMTYPGHVVSWDFKSPAQAESTAILVRHATTKEVKIIAFNLENQPVAAQMTAWDLEPGTWEVMVGVDADGDDRADKTSLRGAVKLERTGELELRFEPKTTTIVELKLLSPATPLWQRPDLGIGRDDVKVTGNQIKVKVHSLGSVDAPASSICLEDPSGKTVVSSRIPPLKAALDLLPKTVEVLLDVPAGTGWKDCRLRIDPDDELDEITNRNNVVVLE